MTKFIQIIPAPSNLYWSCETDDKEIVEFPVLCLALTSAGEVKLLDFDDKGHVIDLTSIENFRRFFWKPARDKLTEQEEDDVN